MFASVCGSGSVADIGNIILDFFAAKSVSRRIEFLKNWSALGAFHSSFIIYPRDEGENQKY